MRHFHLALLAALAAASPVCAQGLDRPGAPPSAQRLETRRLQAVAALTRDAATAQRLGTLAGPRVDTGKVASLSSSMAETNRDLVRNLEQVAGAENMPLRERLRHRDVQSFEALGSDRVTMERQLLAWIAEHYPDMIRNMEMLGQEDERFTPLADSTLPRLRGQLAAAQELAQSDDPQ